MSDKLWGVWSESEDMFLPVHSKAGHDALYTLESWYEPESVEFCHSPHRTSRHLWI